METNSGKYRALLGGLIVFIVPLFVVSWMFLSKKPDVYTLPFLQEQSLSQTTFTTTFDDSLNLSDYSEDVKFVFKTKASNYQAKKELLTPLFEETHTYARKSFKEPYSYVLFVSVLDDKKELIPAENLQEMLWYVVEQENVNDQLLNENLTTNNILLLDTKNRVRGNYELTKEQLPQIKKDLQNLLAETFQTNSKEKRKDKF